MRLEGAARFGRPVQADTPGCTDDRPIDEGRVLLTWSDSVGLSNLSSATRRFLAQEGAQRDADEYGLQQGHVERLTGQFTKTVTEVPRQCARTWPSAARSSLSSIDTTTSQTRAAVGRLTCARENDAEDVKWGREDLVQDYAQRQPSLGYAHGTSLGRPSAVSHSCWRARRDAQQEAAAQLAIRGATCALMAFRECSTLPPWRASRPGPLCPPDGAFARRQECLPRHALWIGDPGLSRLRVAAGGRAFVEYRPVACRSRS